MEILVVEDDAELSDLLVHLLEAGGFEATCVHDGHEALLRLNEEMPAAVILDLNLPRLSGMALLEWIRSRAAIPVLIMTGSPLESAFTNAFALGADDFLRKPFSGQELLVRLRARLGHPQPQSNPRTQLGNLLIDWARAEVFRGTEAILLTSREFQVLHALFQHSDRVLSRQWLLEHVWNYQDGVNERLVDATIKRLRAKIGPSLVETVRGQGFRLAMAYGLYCEQKMRQLASSREAQ
ncbi:MAG: response regulator transcription factor [Candidatus Eremiobacteraeota bacterium]|nr:response regulator transcription factor [Candidatus Eremiobacteraeota bacterium]MCW5872554.1 response regulator transcription factor [Candidatus Eremiobacteraeota bacterium]